MFFLGSIFEAIWGDKSTFYNLEAIKAIWKVSCMFGILFMTFGTIKMATSTRDTKAFITQLIMVAISAFMVTQTAPMLLAYKDAVERVKSSTGFTPATISQSFDRVSTEAQNATLNPKDESSTFTWNWLAGKAADTLGKWVISVIMGVLTGVVWLLNVILKLFYLLQDLIFYFACLVIPLAWGLIGGGFDKSKGTAIIMSMVGLCSWAWCWLLVDAFVLLMLKPLDPQIGGTSVMPGNPRIFSSLVLEGPGGLAMLIVYGLILVIVICIGYVSSIKICHWLFGNIGGGLLEGAMQMTKNVAMAGATLATGGTGGQAFAAMMGEGGWNQALFGGKEMTGPGPTPPSANGPPSGGGGGGNGGSGGNQPIDRDAARSTAPVVESNAANAGERLAAGPRKNEPPSPPPVPKRGGDWREDLATQETYKQDLKSWINAQSAESSSGSSSGAGAVAVASSQSVAPVVTAPNSVVGAGGSAGAAAVIDDRQRGQIPDTSTTQSNAPHAFQKSAGELMSDIPSSISDAAVVTTSNSIVGAGGSAGAAAVTDDRQRGQIPDTAKILSSSPHPLQKSAGERLLKNDSDLEIEEN
jgi:hypothetical protein